ncbi:MAG: hypothetical protein KKB30_07555 [Proteobacteria bacterium]|nr:hypothetical protein [Pseudomonadota bacterium]MBU1717124.1 hypothetical protein [Pseudomonadota bacterium]
MSAKISQQKTISEGVNSNSVLELQEGTMQVVVGIIFATAAIIGIWGLISLFGGIVMAGGILEAAREWMGAITGM